jgi:hypothetical protein
VKSYEKNTYNISDTATQFSIKGAVLAPSIDYRSLYLVPIICKAFVMKNVDF